LKLWDSDLHYPDLIRTYVRGWINQCSGPGCFWAPGSGSVPYYLHRYGSGSLQNCRNQGFLNFLALLYNLLALKPKWMYLQ
jgi:hypothetical protein